jgi:hypothetical protein
MFADPLALINTAATAITIAATSGAGSTTLSFVRTGVTANSSTYRFTYTSSNYIDLFIGRQTGRRSRYTVRLTETELVPSPTDNTQNVVKTSTLYFVADVGPLGTGSHWDFLATILAHVLLKRSDGYQGSGLSNLLLGNV